MNTGISADALSNWKTKTSETDRHCQLKMPVKRNRSVLWFWYSATFLNKNSAPNPPISHVRTFNIMVDHSLPEQLPACLFGGTTLSDVNSPSCIFKNLTAGLWSAE